VSAVDEETALVRRACDGDQAAFAELAAAHRGAVWAVCLGVTGNVHDAEDALQDTLMAAWRYIGQFRTEARFSTWLFRIASNAAVGVVRRRPQLAEDVERLTLGGDPGSQVVESDRVQTALMMLPEAFRVALVLRVYGDLRYDEIAAHQGIPVQTVKSRLSRARAMLQDLLAPI
jgi:RNA polymerase sigma factor (sigma-70 family)